MKLNEMPAVRLRATISIDIEAQDYLEAAEHQKRLQTHLSTVRTDYPAANFAVTERRPPSAITPRRRDARVNTGNLNSYE